MLKSSLLELVLSTSGAKAGKCSNRVFWSSFCRLLEPRPECLKSNLLSSFYQLLEPKPENTQIEPPGAHFVDFWSQSQKMLKSILLEPILSTSGAKARKCSNRVFWNSFCRLLEPRPEYLKSNLLTSFYRRLEPTPENTQIELPGAYFVDF